MPPPNSQPRRDGAYSAQPAGNRVNAAQAGLAAATVTAQGQRLLGAPAAPVKQYNEQLIHELVAEERIASQKLPTYPGLERWILVEKMGDGAFSNVYRARDKTGEFDQVAIKVVRKFELSSTQVSPLFSV
jgi:hypothetical protein